MNISILRLGAQYDLASPPQIVAMLDRAKQNNPQQSVEEDQQEHAGDDEEALQHRHHHSLRQHLQRCL